MPPFAKQLLTMVLALSTTERVAVDPSVEAGIGRATGTEEDSHPRNADLRALKEGKKPEVKTARSRRCGKRDGPTGAKERDHPSDRKTSGRRPIVIAGDVTFSGQDVSGSSDEERNTVMNRLFQLHNQEEFIRTRPKLPPTDFS
jgi:hypothetical protein